jgi:hypothetical protein
VLVIPNGGVVVAWGVGDPLLEDILSSPPKDWYVLRTRTMGPTCTPLAPDGWGTITRLTRAVPLLLGCKVIV